VGPVATWRMLVVKLKYNGRLGNVMSIKSGKVLKEFGEVPMSRWLFRKEMRCGIVMIKLL